jgi:hypothetical protein
MIEPVVARRTTQGPAEGKYWIPSYWRNSVQRDITRIDVHSLSVSQPTYEHRNDIAFADTMASETYPFSSVALFNRHFSGQSGSDGLVFLIAGVQGRLPYGKCKPTVRHQGFPDILAA